MSDEKLHLFEGYGVELEYMLVRVEDLSVLPVADVVLKELAGGRVENEVEVESVSWSNEFVMHVIELKNTDPVPALTELGELFHDHVGRMNRRLESLGAMLLPGGMHPWMRPREETKFWPHDAHEIYETFHRIFDCRRHGWANLQSAQLNLSFGDDAEFGKLHAAIRLVLPILAPLAASSPIAEGEVTGLLDTRLEAYRTNSERVPSVSGATIPEPVFTERDYEREIFDPMYEEIAPYDPESVLRHQWLNARGAIAQFSRDAIEIRVLDMQECPQADIAISAAISAVIEALIGGRWTAPQDQRRWDVEPLAEIFLQTLKDAEQAVIRNRDYLRMFGFPEKVGTAHELWLHLLEELGSRFPGSDAPHLGVIMNNGPLARRILRVTGPQPTREDIEMVYRALARCLASGESFLEP